MIWLLVLVALAGLVAWLVARAVARGRSPLGMSPRPVAPGADAAMEQLRVRYARGEIGSEEYRARAYDLGYPPPPAPTAPPPSGPPVSGPPPTE